MTKTARSPFLTSTQGLRQISTEPSCSREESPATLGLSRAWSDCCSEEPPSTPAGLNSPRLDTSESPERPHTGKASLRPPSGSPRPAGSSPVSVLGRSPSPVITTISHFLLQPPTSPRPACWPPSWARHWRPQQLEKRTFYLT